MGNRDPVIVEMSLAGGCCGEQGIRRSEDALGATVVYAGRIGAMIFWLA
jgi:hypothetical protein